MSNKSDFFTSAYQQALRFGFRLLYNEMAFTYDTVSWLVSLGEWRNWQRAVIKHLNVAQGACILELAHGTANLQIDLRTAGLESIGLDLSPYMGRIARQKLLHNRITPRLVQGQSQALPFPSDSFPAVVSTFPTEFIVDPKTLSEVYRVLKPDGRLVFVPAGGLTTGGIAQQGIELAYRVTGQGTAKESDSSDPWPSKIQSRFEQVGFSLNRVIEHFPHSIAQVYIATKVEKRI